MPAMGLAEPCDWQSECSLHLPLGLQFCLVKHGGHRGPHECAEGGRMSSQGCGGVPPGGGLARGGLAHLRVSGRAAAFLFSKIDVAQYFSYVRDGVPISLILYPI